MPAFYIRSAILDCFTEVIGELGGDADVLLQRANIQSHLLSDPDALIPHWTFVSLLREAVAATGCQHLGLLLGARTGLQSFGLLGLLLRSASTLREATQELIKHLQIHSSGITRELRAEGDVAYIACVLESPEMLESVEAIQMSVALTWKLSQLLTRGRWHPTTIYFSCAEPEDHVYYQRFFRAPVLFNRDFNGIVFHAADLDIPLPGQDAFLHQQVKKQVEQLEMGMGKDFVSEVRHCIHKNLAVGVCSMNAVVAFFPFQKRTFQKKLKHLGLSYQELLDEVRFQKAEVYLQTSDLSISMLADLLCYKSSSVFSTAFRNRHGLSPSAWRKQQRVIGTRIKSRHAPRQSH